jgi:hypothetical protein
MKWYDTSSLAAFSSTVLSLHKDIHHRAINLGPFTTSIYPQIHRLDIFLLRSYASYTHE